MLLAGEAKPFVSADPHVVGAATVANPGGRDRPNAAGRARYPDDAEDPPQPQDP